METLVEQLQAFGHRAQHLAEKTAQWTCFIIE
jgi:hypothetical protein